MGDDGRREALPIGCLSSRPERVVQGPPCHAQCRRGDGVKGAAVSDPRSPALDAGDFDGTSGFLRILEEELQKSLARPKCARERNAVFREAPSPASAPVPHGDIAPLVKVLSRELRDVIERLARSSRATLLSEAGDLDARYRCSVSKPGLQGMVL
jgi:hypothetical protein